MMRRVAIGLGLAVTVYLPYVVTSQPTQPRAPFQLTPPAGISCFHHDTVIVEHGGALWWNSQCQNNAGQLVFRTDQAGTQLMHTGSEGGLGTLYVAPDGYLYLAVGSLSNPRHTSVEPVTGWVP
jgi:streptogramin lyase